MVLVYSCIDSGICGFSSCVEFCNDSTDDENKVIGKSIIMGTVTNACACVGGGGGEVQQNSAIDCCHFGAVKHK